MFGLKSLLRRPPARPEALWLDEPDALARVERAPVSEAAKQAARDLIVDGFTVLRGAIPGELCQQVIDDYARYGAENADYVAANLDELAREKRLVNFHHWSKAEEAIATDAGVMSVLDFLFGERACVYTSLTFKYGTQQPIHRDTPHFATWPGSRFFGVWTALEDTPPEAGPLMYVRGGHRFPVEPRPVFEAVQAEHPDWTREDQLNLALDRWNGLIIQQAPDHGELVVAPIRRGDVAIWHPQLPHGGSPAQDPTRTRWSVVVHCAPEGVQVHQHDRFFTHAGPDAPPDRYRFREAHGRKIALAGEVAYQA